MLYLLLLVVSAPFFFIRGLRWLAIVQQKEYRIDRLLSFLNSAEGKADFFRVVPQTSEFTRTGLKRPVTTLRVVVVAGIFGVLFLLLVGYLLLTNFSVPLFTLSIIALYVVLPLLIILSCVPSSVVSHIITVWTLMQARRKITAHQPKIIGVGGSYGKTSTKHLLHHVLSQKFSVFVTPKSHNTKYSVAKSIVRSFTQQDIALLEYGAYTRGEIAYLTKWFHPDIVIETGFTLQHLGLFGSKENSILAEAELVAALLEKGKAFCNGADEGAIHICEVGRQKNHAEVVMYGGPFSRVQVSDAQVNDVGQLQFRWNKQKIHTQLVGIHYLVNVQGVIAVAQELGMSDEEIVTGLESFVPSASFVRSFETSTKAIIIDDGGTSNPRGFEAAINLAEAIKKKKKILFTSGIVDLGKESDDVHRHLAKKADVVFSTVVYLGTDGKEVFEKVCGEKVVSGAAAAFPLLDDADEDTLLLIEGRMPKSLQNKVDGLKR